MEVTLHITISFMIYRLGSFISPSDTEEVSAVFKSVPESDPAPVIPQPFPQRFNSFTVRGNQSPDSCDQLPGCHLPFTWASSGCFSGMDLPQLPRSAPGPAGHTAPTSLRQEQAHCRHEVDLLVGWRVPHTEVSVYSRPFLAFKLHILCNLKYSGLLTPSHVLLTGERKQKRIYSRKE